METIESLNNYFLIATPQITDPFFSGTVIYIFDHTKDGAMGLIINKPSPLKMNQLFDAVDEPTPKEYEEKWLLIGGPVQIDRGFLIHSPIGNWKSSLLINDSIAITTSKDVIKQLTNKTDGHFKSIATIGHSLWSKGQMEEEIQQNAWLTVPADYNILFNLPYFKRYKAALDLLGINLAQLGGSSHA